MLVNAKCCVPVFVWLCRAETAMSMWPLLSHKPLFTTPIAHLFHPCFIVGTTQVVFPPHQAHQQQVRPPQQQKQGQQQEDPARRALSWQSLLRAPVTV